MSYIFNYLSHRFPEVPPITFYREIFPAGELQKKASERNHDVII